MKALTNLLAAIAKSDERFDLDLIEILMVSEFEEYFVVLSWDNSDYHFLVNHFYKDRLGWDMTHTETTSYNEAVRLFCKIVVQD